MANLKTVLRAQAEGASDIFLIPKFESIPVFVHYTEGVLDKQRMPTERTVLTRSGFKLRLYKEGEKLARIEAPKHLRIACDLVEYKGQEWVIGRRIERRARGEWKSLDLSRVLQLHVLQAKGILTVLPLCSWLSVVGQKPDSSAKCRPLPSTEAKAARQLDTRLADLNDVLRGKREHYWSERGLYHKRDTGFGNRRLPVKEITDLLVGDVCM